MELSLLWAGQLPWFRSQDSLQAVVGAGPMRLVLGMVAVPAVPMLVALQAGVRDPARVVPYGIPSLLSSSDRVVNST